MDDLACKRIQPRVLEFFKGKQMPARESVFGRNNQGRMHVGNNEEAISETDLSNAV